MFCEKCGMKIKENSKFCETCGTLISSNSTKELNITDEKKIINFDKAGEKSTKVFISEKRKSDSNKKKLNKKTEISIFILIFICLVGVNSYIFRDIFFKKDKIVNSSNTNNVISKDIDKNENNESSDTNNDVDKKESNDNKGLDNNGKSKLEDTKEENKKYTHNYKLIQSNLNWEESMKYCESLGGHLATITSKEEEENVLAIVNSSDVKVLWLGANDLNSTGKFKWVNGEDFSYHSWAINEPNNENGVEHYLVLYKIEGNWLWNDGPINTNEYYKAENIGFVCEWEVEE